MTEFPQSANQSPDPGTDMAAGGGGIWQWLRGFFGSRNAESSVRETIEGLIEEPAGQAAAINPEESALIANILKLPDLTAEDVMIPRADIVAIDETSALHTVADLIGKEAHSRLPIFRGQLDDVVGFVHIKDVLTAIRTSPHDPVGDLQHDILFAAPSIRVLDLLLEMRAHRTHMAIVVDEFGGVDGLVTIEDLVEEIVGEIEDEHDGEDGPTFAHNPDGSILADARVKTEDLEDLIGLFLTDAEREESDTLGGVVFALIDRVPRRSEVVTHSSGVEFEVVDADARRIKLLRVRDQRPGDVHTPSS